MSDFDYKKYSLENLENWLHDAMSSDVTSNEIYDCIVNVVRDNYYHHKKYADESSALLIKLGSPLFEYTATGEKWTDFWEAKGLDQYTEEELDAMCERASTEELKKTCIEQYRKNNLQTKLDNETEQIRKAGGYEWTPLPQEYLDSMYPDIPDDLNVPIVNRRWVLPVEQVHDDYFISFPDDLLEAANLKEGDEVNWIDNGDGSYKIVKISKKDD